MLYESNELGLGVCACPKRKRVLYYFVTDESGERQKVVDCTNISF